MLSISLFFIALAFSEAQSGAAGGGSGGECACQGLFCSVYKKCSVKGYSCTCTCGLALCTCTPCSINQIAEPGEVTIDNVQKQNRKDIIILLKSFRTSEATEIATLIDESTRALLENNNLEAFKAKGILAEEKLKTLPPVQKDAVNNWLISKNSDLRY